MIEDENQLIDVSVVMITYGHENYIRDAIEGVKSQEFSGVIELLISNDKSPDKTDEVISEYISNNNIPSNIIVRYFNQEDNLGMTENFNFLLGQVRGKYLAFCEGDDYWIDTKKIQKQFDILEADSSLGLVSTNVNILKVDGNFLENVIGTDSYPVLLDFESFLKWRGYMAPCSWLMRSKVFFEIYDYEHITSDGSFFIFCSILATSKVHFLEDTTSVYRILEESASHSKNVIKNIERELGLYGTEKYLVSKFESKFQANGIKEFILNRHIQALATIVFNKKNRSLEGEFYLRQHYPVYWDSIETELNHIIKMHYLPRRVFNKILTFIKLKK